VLLERGLMRTRFTLFLAMGALCACPPIHPDLSDNPEEYIDNAAYRRGILERDLITRDNSYATDRLASYGIAGIGWDLLPAVDFPSRPLLDSDREALSNGEAMDEGELTTLVPSSLPVTDEDWIALGRRVFFEYPIRNDTTYTSLSGMEDGLEDTGFLRDSDDSWVGLRVFKDSLGTMRVGNTCAQCHASFDGADEPGLDGILSNRDMDIGAARIMVMGLVPGDLPPEQESTATGDLDRLGPGRGDVMADGAFNPFAFPDFGGLRDMPFLHHNANWEQRGVATLAVRCETLFITSSGRRTRIPRVLSWALGMWQRSLPAPVPLSTPGPLYAQGETVFEEAGCAGCHVPPLYSSNREVSVESIGTDPSAGNSPVRGRGVYRIPSLRGVGRTAPYLHDGSIGSLSEFFDPEREAQGHIFGQSLSPSDKEALIQFLEGI